jgi:hypothetical protein
MKTRGDIDSKHLTNMQLRATLKRLRYVRGNVRLGERPDLKFTIDEIEGEGVIKDVYVPLPSQEFWTYACDLCGKRFIDWWVLHHRWRQRPLEYRNKLLCLFCFGQHQQVTP